MDALAPFVVLVLGFCFFVFLCACGERESIEWGVLHQRELNDKVVVLRAIPNHGFGPLAVVRSTKRERKRMGEFLGWGCEGLANRSNSMG